MYPAPFEMAFVYPMRDNFTESIGETNMFNLEAFFNTIFQPRSGDRVAVMCDLPHTESIPDNEQWKARREMAAEWVSKLSTFPSLQHIEVKPLVTYLATKGNNQDLPVMCRMGEAELPI
jgi:hypothetical protein